MDQTPVYGTLREANAARQREWDKKDDIDASYRGNEFAGECGEALERAVDLILLAVAGGKACNVIKKLERERLGIRGSRATLDELADEMADVIICADLIAMKFGIDLDAAVARKFNATSEKVGLATRLQMAGQDASPRRRIVMNAKIEADDWHVLKGELRHLETQIAMHGSLSRCSVSGGYSSGHIITVDEDETITHDAWAAANQAYVDALPKSGEGRG